MPAPKKKIIKSLDSLSDDLLELIPKQYPTGYQSSLTRISTPKKESIFVFPLETEDTTYLVKVPATKNSEGEYDVDFRKKSDQGEFGKRDEDDDLGSDSDDMDQEDDYNDGDDGDDDGGMSRGRKDPSYDPDFDN